MPTAQIGVTSSLTVPASVVCTPPPLPQHLELQRHVEGHINIVGVDFSSHSNNFIAHSAPSIPRPRPRRVICKQCVLLHVAVPAAASALPDPALTSQTEIEPAPAVSISSRVPNEDVDEEGLQPTSRFPTTPPPVSQCPNVFL
ncbi:hypothetical protein DFH29DRAFT_1005803 [Suillus ampliporus]|nr:hypothetical protein DFH29DRAFT_1005803 [Suillus ampliporus]